MLYKNLPKFDDNSYAHFITTNTYNNYPYFKHEELCQILIEELEFYSRKYGFALIGYVIMPDHLHLLVWWDKEEKPGLSISRVTNSIKTMTAKRIKRRLFYNGGSWPTSANLPGDLFACGSRAFTTLIFIARRSSWRSLTISIATL